MTPTGDLGVNEIIRMLGMRPHPEGGHYAKPIAPNRDRTAGRASPRSIFCSLLTRFQPGTRSTPPKTWLWQAGAPLSLSWSEDGVSARNQRLGPNLRSGERPQLVIPPHAWQTAESLGAWTLVSCLVAPGFEFEGFELAPKDWRPGPDGAP